MERYEYKMVPIGPIKKRAEMLDELGSNGWELVEIHLHIMYFKRVKRSY